MKKYQLHHGLFELHYMRLHGLCTMPDRFQPCEEFSIVVDERLRGRDKLDTLIHELIHAEHPGMSEEDVARTATNIASVVWGEGWREKT